MTIIAPLAIILFSLIGLCDEKFLKDLIKFNNEIRGIKTEITKTTISYSKFVLVLVLVIGVIALANQFFGKLILPVIGL